MEGVIGLLVLVVLAVPVLLVIALVSVSTLKQRVAALEQQVVALQHWLNGFPGVFVKVDGIPGQRTSEAYRQVTGHYLPGDPRQAQRQAA